MLSSGSASVLGAYGIFGFCLVVSNYFKYCIIHLFQIGMCGKKTKGIWGTLANVIRLLAPGSTPLFCSA